MWLEVTEKPTNLVYFIINYRWKKLYNQDSWNLMSKTDIQNNNKKDYSHSTLRVGSYLFVQLLDLAGSD